MLDVRTKSKEMMTVSKGFKMVHVVVWVKTYNQEPNGLLWKNIVSFFSPKNLLHTDEFLNEFFYKFLKYIFKFPQCITIFLLVIIE
jgi:hypothetical protein